MIRTAFSTVACPEWTLDQVARIAGDLGFDGVDLRTGGQGGGERCPVACDPGLTGASKVRRLFADEGVGVCSLATDVCFDEPIFPPVLGNVLPQREQSVRLGKHMVELGSSVGAEFVRFFPLEIPRFERRHGCLRRICERLGKVCDHARNRDVRVVIENEGAFASASDLIEILDNVASPHLGASYNILAGACAGDDVPKAIEALGPRLAMLRVRDVEDQWPVPLGEGELPVAESLGALGEVSTRWGTRPWAVFNWDRAGVAGLDGPDVILPGVSERLVEWSGGRSASGTRSQPAWMSAAPAMILGF